MNLPKAIVHCADIHIGSNKLRSAEYRKIFDKFAKNIHDHQKLFPVVVVIVGDIFHAGVHYSGQDVADFNYLLNLIADIPIVIVPGNHDSNLRDFTDEDLLTPIIPSNNITTIHYQKYSGSFQFAGVDFYHHSVFDESPVVIPDDASQRVFLYHGMVNGMKFGSHKVAGKPVSVETLQRFKISCLGDVHQQQYIECGHVGASPHAYCGSLIQQTVAESTEKGYMLWNLKNNRGKFMVIPNDTGLLKLDLRGMTAEQVTVAIESLTVPNNLLKMSVISDAPDNVFNDQLVAIRAKTGRVDKIARPVIAINPSQDIISSLTEMLAKRGAAQEQIDDIINKHAGITTYECTRWYVKSMMWDNLFAYGSGNVINFDTLTIGGIIADNESGKTSIIDILVFALFNKHMRACSDSVIRHGMTTGFVKVEFVVSDILDTSTKKIYTIERTCTKSRHNNIVLTVSEHSDQPGRATERAITCKTLDATYNLIAEKIGTLDQFLSTGLYYKGQNDIIHGQANRVNMLSSLFGMDVDHKLIANLKKEKTECTKKLAALKKPIHENPHSLLIESRAKHDALADKKKELVVVQNEKRIECTKLQILIGNRRSTSEISRELLGVQNEIASKSSSGEISGSLPEIEQTIASLESRKMVFIPSTREMEDHIATLKSKSNINLTFADGCANCKCNRTIIENHPQLSNGFTENAIAEAQAKLTDIRKEIARVTEQNNIHTRQLANARMTRDTLLRAAKMKAEVDTLRSRESKLMEELNANREPAQFKQLLSLQEEVNQLTLKISAIDKNIGATRLYIEQLDQDVKTSAIYNEAHPTLQKQLSTIVLHLDCMNGTELRMGIIAKNISRVIESANNILVSIVDFRLKASIIGEKIDIMIVKPNGFTQPIAAGSGFQEFISSIALRLALTSTLPSAPSFIMIDEGFGCMSPNKRALIPDIFSDIAPLYKFLFIISHINELHSALQQPLHIKVDVAAGNRIGKGVVKTEDVVVTIPEVKDKKEGGIDKTIVCEVCNKTIKLKSLKAHEKSKAHQKRLVAS